LSTLRSEFGGVIDAAVAIERIGDAQQPAGQDAEGLGGTAAAGDELVLEVLPVIVIAAAAMAAR